MSNPDHQQVSESESIELRLLLEAIYLKYGYDFRRYSKASLKRRVQKVLETAGLGDISALTHRVLYERSFFEAMLHRLTVNVTEMFRDQAFFSAVREHVLPVLEDHAHLKIWHAGCATGEEVYSMAILLAEAGLYEQTLIYATDLNEAVLEQARQGIYPLDRMRSYTGNYQKAGGTGSFADYYAARYDAAVMDPELKKNLVFSAHDLATDGVFGEMDVIVCRNVLIYFEQKLQDRVLDLFVQSLSPGGFLCLGSKETIRFSAYADAFEVFSAQERIYRKRDA